MSSVMHAWEIPVDGHKKVTFREPLVTDRREVLNQIKPGNRVPVDELVAIYCLLDLDGEKIKNPDPFSRINGWTYKENQFYTNYFLWMFVPDDEEMLKVKENAKEAAKNNERSLKLPSGRAVTFHEPLIGDRQMAIAAIPPEEQRASVEEMLALQCMDTIDGIPTTDDKDPKARIRLWTLRDAQHYINHFLWMFQADDPDMEKVRAAAKNAASALLSTTSS